MTPPASTASPIVVIGGSHRADSQSSRVAAFVASRLADAQGVASGVLDLAHAGIPLWDEGVWCGDAAWARTWQPVANRLLEAAGVVLVVPEWGGMAPPAVKNLLLLCGRELAHKPALIVSISSGEGGTYPVAELRAFGAKNNRLCYVPEHVILRHVNALLRGPVAEDQADARARDRIDHALGVLVAYASALASVRASGAVDLDRFPYGM